MKAVAATQRLRKAVVGGNAAGARGGDRADGDQRAGRFVKRRGPAATVPPGVEQGLFTDQPEIQLCVEIDHHSSLTDTEAREPADCI